MLTNFKRFFIKIHSDSLPYFLKGGKRKTTLFYIVFYGLILSSFFTIFGQIPFFASRSLTQIFELGWLALLIPILMLDYKRLLKSFLLIICLFLPFGLYGVIALLCKIPSLSYGGTKEILLSLYIFVIGNTFSKYKTSTSIRTILFSFLIGAFIYAAIVYITKLRGYGIDNEIYAFGSKNSAGPIFISAAIISFYLFSGKKIYLMIIKWALIVFFVIIVALSKNRAMLITLPFLIGIMLYIDINKTWVSFVVFGSFILFIVLIFAIPQLYETIVVKILFNNKRTIDEIFSGRLTQIIVSMQNIKPILGNGGNYFDCMPLSFLCTYGVFGLLSMIPLIILPFFIVHRFRANKINGLFSQLLIILSVLFAIDSLFEGYGLFGPGAKTFIFWLLIGLSVFELEPLMFVNYKINKCYVKLSHVPNFLSTSVTLISAQIVLLIMSTIVVAYKPITLELSNSVIERLPKTNIVSEYIKVDNVVIESPIETMCEGQRITFKALESPNDIDDKLVRWSLASWIPNQPIEVDQLSGEVLANQTGFGFLSLDVVGKTQGPYIKIPIIEYDKYNFDSLYISTAEYKKSFNFKDNVSINLATGCTSNAFYDNYYLPNNDDFEFVSSDESIALVDPKTGVIRAVSEGTCYIFGKIDNAFHNESVNKITINVSTSDFVPVTSLTVDCSQKYYEYTPCEFIPVFNDGASDTNIVLEITGVPYIKTNGKICFQDVGTAHIKVVSQSNSSIAFETDIEISENRPSHFVCNTTRMSIGEKKDAKDLGLYLVFENGYRKIVEMSDLEYTLYPFENRAWEYKNGLVNDLMTVYSVTKGTVSFELTSKIDNNIKATFSIICSVYTEKELSDLISKISVAIITIVTLLSIFFTLFIQLDKNKNWIIDIALVSLIVLVSLMICFRYWLGFATLIPLILITLLYIVTILLRYKFNKKIPILFLEEPINLSYTPRYLEIKI